MQTSFTAALFAGVDQLVGGSLHFLLLAVAECVKGGQGVLLLLAVFQHPFALLCHAQKYGAQVVVIGGFVY